MTEDQKRIALLRQIWATLEKLHIVTYFVRECRDAYKSLGVENVWSRYFAGRAAPMGRVTYETIVATFYNFSPSMVKEHAESVWEAAGPESFVSARFRGADNALQRLLGEYINFPEIGTVPSLVYDIALKGSPEGKPIYSANLGVSVPDKLHLKLFHAATLVREYKGDIHNSILLSSDVSGLQAHILLSSIGHMSKEKVLSSRGWSEQQWLMDQRNLQSRGLLGEDGLLSQDGLAFRVEIEGKTETLAAKLWDNLDDKALGEINESLSPLNRQLSISKELPNFTPTYEDLIK